MEGTRVGKRHEPTKKTLGDGMQLMNIRLSIKCVQASLIVRINVIIPKIEFVFLPESPSIKLCVIVINKWRSLSFMKSNLLNCFLKLILDGGRTVN